MPSSSASKSTEPITSTGRARLSLDLEPKVKTQLESLRGRSGAATLSEVIRRSLALYDVVVDHKNDGGSVVFKHADGSEERLMIL